MDKMRRRLKGGQTESFHPDEESLKERLPRSRVERNLEERMEWHEEEESLKEKSASTVAKEPVGTLKWRKEDATPEQWESELDKESTLLKVGKLKWKKEDNPAEEQVPDPMPQKTSLDPADDNNSSPVKEGEETNELAASAAQLLAKNENNETTLQPDPRPSRVKAKSKGADQKSDLAEESKKKPLGRRMLRLFVKIVWFPALITFALVIGLMVGYGVLGAKEVEQDLSVSDVFDIELWKHLYNLIYG